MLKTRAVVGYDVFLVPDLSLIFRYVITAEETEKLCKDCLCTTVTYFFHLGKKKDFPQPPFNIWSLSHQSLVENM